MQLSFEDKLKIIILIFSLWVIVVTSMIFSRKMDEVRQTIKLKSEEYAKAYPLAVKVISSGAQKKLFNKSAVEFVNFMVDKVMVKDKLVSSSSFKSPLGEGIYVRLSNLSLLEVIKLLERISSYSNVEIYQMKIARSFTVPDKLDVDMKILIK